MTGSGKGFFEYDHLRMGSCQKCGESSPIISNVIGFCAECIRAHFEEVCLRSRRFTLVPVNPTVCRKILPELSPGLPATFVCTNVKSLRAPLAFVDSVELWTAR